MTATRSAEHPPRTDPDRTLPVVLSLAAAFGWATYYLFVLWATPAATPSAILVLPFLVGGGAYLASSLATGSGGHFVRLFASPAAYVRILLLVGMQISVLAATYLTGPVDASLLSLIGDVVATPLVVAAVFGIHRAQVTSAAFGVGLLLSVLGGGLAIVGGQRLAAIPPLGWLVVPAIPITVAFYFLLTARANETMPRAAVVGQSMLGSALVLAALSPLIPGGAGTLLAVPPRALLLLVATGLTSFFVAPVLYFRAIGRAGLVIPPMLMTGIPVFTLLLSAVFLGIAPPLIGVLGIPIAVVGALVILRAESDEPSVPPPAAGPT